MKIRWLVAIGLLALILNGCEKKTVIVGPDNQAPAAPRGVTSITGDGEVAIQWFANGEGDLDGYRVWRATEPNGINGGPYTEIANLNATSTSFVDLNRPYGVTYFYAVSAYDNSGNESDLSPEDVHDTPRPDGTNWTMSDFNSSPTTAGFAFTNSAPYGFTVGWTSASADIYAEYVPADGVFFINVTDVNTDIQDMGYTESLDDISYAPPSGWSAVGWVEAIVGHTYVIWTSDNHYAKIRVTAISGSGVTIDWAYQLDTDGLGHLELKPVVRPKHDPATYLRRSVK